MQLKGKCSKSERSLIDWILIVFDCTEKKETEQPSNQPTKKKKKTNKNPKPNQNKKKQPTVLTWWN